MHKHFGRHFHTAYAAHALFTLFLLFQKLFLAGYVAADKVVKSDGEIIYVDNPSHLPPQSEIEHMEEPIVKADIYSPPDYLGQIMDLCREKRGTFLQMTYLDKSRVRLEYELPLNEIIFDFFVVFKICINTSDGTSTLPMLRIRFLPSFCFSKSFFFRVRLEYELPLNEIIFDFFDAIKSRTRGYASFDYELKGYEQSKLVKLDILLNGEPCDALSTDCGGRCEGLST